MTEIVFLEGALNGADPIFGLPIYAWLLILWWFIIMPIAWVGLKGFLWTPYEKFHGLYFAHKNDSSAVLIVDWMGNADMIAEHKAKCIFDYSEDDYEITIPELPLKAIRTAGIISAIVGIIAIVMGSWIAGLFLVACGIAAYYIEKVASFAAEKLFWYPTKYLDDISFKDAVLYKLGGINFDCKIAQKLQNGEWAQYPVVVCGGIPVEIIYDTNQWCKKKTPEHLAIKKFCRQWNVDNPDNQIHTYAKLQRLYNEGALPEIPGVKFSYLVTWTRIDAGFPYFPMGDYDGKLCQMAKKKEQSRDQVPATYLKYIIIASVVIFIVGLIIKGVFTLIQAK